MSSKMRNAQKQLEREQEKRERKYIQKEIKTDYNENLGIKKLKGYNNKQLGERFRELGSLNWIIEKWYEKIILFTLLVFGCWKLIELILQ